MKDKFVEIFGEPCKLDVTASGRINLIGEHIDYCGGKVFPASIGLKCQILAKKNESQKISIYLFGLGLFTINLDSIDDYKTTKYINYEAGVIWKLIKEGYKVGGCDLYLKCDVPFGSGLSSSASIEVATAVTMCELFENNYTLKEIACLCQRAENEYVGTKCGIMDQFASAMGKKNSAILLDCSTLNYSYYPLDLGSYSLVIIDSKKTHTLSDGDYNTRRQETSDALSIIQKKKNITNLCELNKNDDISYLPELLQKRVQHVVSECERVDLTVKALQSGDIKRVGVLLNMSHNSLSKNYDVTGYELDCLQNSAISQPCCIGSRMIGGGFGGCTISLVESDKVDEFIQNTLTLYKEKTGICGKVYLTTIDDGVTIKKYD